MTKKLLLILALLVPVEGWAADRDTEAFSSCASGACGGGDTTLTFSLTVGANSNRALNVFVFIGCTSGSTGGADITGVTYNGVPLTAIATEAPAAQRRGEQFALGLGVAAAAEPATGAHDIVVTLGEALAVRCTSGRLSAGAFSAYNVDATQTFTSTADASGSGATSSVTGLTSGASDLGTHGHCGGSALSSPTGTERWNNTDESAGCNSSVGATTAAGVTTFSASLASDTWIAMAAVFKNAVGAPAANPSGMLLRGVQ